MGSDLIVTDTLYADQIERQDYVRFTDTSGVVRTGFVLDTEDLGDVFLITLSDDVEGDKDSYEVTATEKVVDLMMHAAVAV